MASEHTKPNDQNAENWHPKKPEDGTGAIFSRVEQSVFAQLRSDLVNTTGDTRTNSHNKEHLIVRTADKLARGYAQNLRRIHGIYAQRGISVNNLLYYALAVTEERENIVNALKKELNDAKDADQIVTLQEELRLAELALDGAEYLVTVYKKQRLEASRVGNVKSGTPGTAESDEPGEWDLSGDRGVNAQLKVFDRIRSEISGLQLVLSGSVPADHIPLASGKNREALSEQVRFLECIEELLARFSPENDESVHKWYEEEENSIIEKMSLLDNDDEIGAKELSLKKNALSRAYALLVEADNPQPQAIVEIPQHEHSPAAKKQSDGEQPTPVGKTNNRTEEVTKTTEKAREQALLSEVLRAAKGSARIETSVTTRSPLTFKDGDAVAPADGCSLFGDGVERGKFPSREHSEYIAADDSPEAVIFEPATETGYATKTETVKSGLFGKATREKQVPTGEVPIMVTNPLTGLQEAGYKFRYQFNGNSGYDYDSQTSRTKGYPPYRSAEENGRKGNYLFVEVTLPESTAHELKKAILHNPTLARQYVQAILAGHGAIDGTVRMPPYDALPSGWTMAVADMHKQDKTHHVVARYDVTV